MPRYRSRLVPIAQQDKDANEALRNLTDNGITAIRRRRGGEITAVKHVTYGWISAKEYGEHRILKQSVPVFIEIVKGGYMMKAALWTTVIPVEAFGTGSGVPVGFLIVTIAIILYELDKSNGLQMQAWMDLAALALPFGELWLLYRGATYFQAAFSQVGSNVVGSAENALQQIWNALQTPGEPLSAGIIQALQNLGLVTLPAGGTVGPF